MKDFIFDYIILPLFGKQIEEMLYSEGLIQVYSVEAKGGPVYAWSTRPLPLDANVVFYQPKEGLYDPDTSEFLGNFEDVYGYGRVVEENDIRSKIVCTRLFKELTIGTLIKFENPIY